jgi:hypothetical protein
MLSDSMTLALEVCSRRLERSRLKGGAVERPCLDDKQHIVERRSLRAALRAPVETTGNMVG